MARIRRLEEVLAREQAKDEQYLKDITGLRNENESLLTENDELRRQIRQLKRQVGKLTARKAELKNGLSSMTQNRDLERNQKEDLQAELLETRKVRGKLCLSLCVYEMQPKISLFKI